MCMRRPFAKAGIFLVAVLALFSLAVAAEPSHDELVKLAQAEGALTIYTNSSRHSNAGETFEKMYGIKVFSTQLKDMEIIEKISREAAAGVKGADLVFVQDSGRVYGELLEPGYAVNYIPPSMADIIPEMDLNPLVFEFVIKGIVFNSEKSEESPIANIWELTDPEWKGRVQMKDPLQEAVNINFLSMLTREDWSGKLAAAYEEHYGKPIELTTENAGYEWIKRFFSNGVILGTSDTKLAENVGATGQDKQLIGIFTTNKTRSAGQKNLALGIAKNITPFSGFYYPMYVLLPSNGQNINAAKLFAEFILTADGFKPWTDSPGDYPSNPEIKTNEHDIPMTEWAKILVREDPEWSFEKRAEVEDFLNGIL